MNTTSNKHGVTSFPLAWPSNRQRTPSSRRSRSRFDTTFAVARDELLREISRLRGKSVVLSTNVALRNDGLPYANQRNPDDCGVAVYFVDSKGRGKCFACDRWDKVEDNMHAIRKTIEALRGIERWGSGEDMEAAFSGFAALPAPAQSKCWYHVLECRSDDAWATIVTQYRRLTNLRHPDRGGSTEAMQELNRAYEQVKRLRGEG
jgi:hypothetical protein